MLKCGEKPLAVSLTPGEMVKRELVQINRWTPFERYVNKQLHYAGVTTPL
jgi:hypothetical protein